MPYTQTEIKGALKAFERNLMSDKELKIALDFYTGLECKLRRAPGFKLAWFEAIRRLDSLRHIKWLREN